MEGSSPFLQNQWVRMRRGAQCAPGELSDSARLHGASRTPPPTAYMQISVYPWRADGEHRPLQNEGRGHLAPEGSIGRGRKGVKKNAALLHFLVFAFSDHIFGVPRGERLAAHNERRQFAAQTRSCGYSPRWGEHCSLPSFAALNRGPLLATPQSPRPGFAASEQRDFFRFLFWSQKRKA